MKNGTFTQCIFSTSFQVCFHCLYRAMEFRDQVESKGLAAVATELSETVTDPKIQATEVNKQGMN